MRHDFGDLQPLVNASWEVEEEEEEEEEEDTLGNQNPVVTIGLAMVRTFGKAILITRASRGGSYQAFLTLGKTPTSAFADLSFPQIIRV